MKINYRHLLYIFPMVLGCGELRGQTVIESMSAINVSDQDPTDAYLKALRLCTNEAETLAANHDYVGAIEKVKQAERVFTALAKSRPDWRASMVAQRRQTNLENIEKWTKAAKENAIQIVPLSPQEGTNTPRQGQKPNQPGEQKDIPSFDDLNNRRQDQLRQNEGQTPPSRRYDPVDFAPIVDIQSPYERQAAQIRKLDYENQALIQALKESQSEIIEALAIKNKAQARASVNQEKYDALEAQIKKEREQNIGLIESLTKRYNQVEEELRIAQAKNREADKKIEDLQKRVDEFSWRLAEVTKERDMLKTERDELAAIVAFNSPENLKELFDSNLTLTARLKEAQETIAKLEAEKSDDSDQMAANLNELEKARSEEVLLRAKLRELVDENTGYRKRISELDRRLRDTQAELEKTAGGTDVDPLILEENSLLRSAISKQILVLATQQKARTMLFEEYKQQNNENPVIEEALQLLENKKTLELSPAEQALVKTIAATKHQEQQYASISGQMEQNSALKQQFELEATGRLAEQFFNNGYYAAAEQSYKSFIKQQPDHFAARVNLGTILIKRNSVDEAIEHLTKANELSPDNAVVHYMLGLAYYRKGQDKNAIANFDKATRLEPDNADAYFCMANIESTAGNWRKAVDYYDKALKIKPNMVDALFNKAATLAGANKITQARQSYDLAIKEGATPDYELQRILDPNASSLPVPEKPKATSGPSEHQPSIASVIDPVEREQQTIRKDLAQLPDVAQKAPVANIKTEPTREDTIKTPSPSRTNERSTPKKETRQPGDDKEEQPKNRRWFRFG